MDQKSQNKCCVPGCENLQSSSDCWFYEFPDDQDLFNTWIRQCGISPNTKNKDYSMMICSAHFDAYSFRNDGELYDDAVPSQNLPQVNETNKNTEIALEPSHLFVALFLDESGKIVNFSLVQYKTIEKWLQNDNLEYAVAEIFTNAADSVDAKLGLMGAEFNCNSCDTKREFGVVVMQKREKNEEILEIEQDEDEIEEEQENEIQVESENLKDKSICEETPIEELEERLVEYSSSTKVPEQSQKRKHGTEIILYPTRKPTKSRLIPPEPTHDTGKSEEIVHGITFHVKRSCNKCDFTSNDENILQRHVETCKDGYLTKLGFNNFKQSNRIRVNYSCSKCSLSILHRDLEAHAEFHINCAPFVCKCSKFFVSEEELAEHSKNCGLHVFTCKICHKEFVRKKDVMQHKMEVHDIDPQANKKFMITDYRKVE
uniref:CSON012773 protein n=1 Tax=Culicoides sonorensis TaxID=179676 RepID=A0A336M8X7_CULSO